MTGPPWAYSCRLQSINCAQGTGDEHLPWPSRFLSPEWPASGPVLGTASLADHLSTTQASSIGSGSPLHTSMPTVTANGHKSDSGLTSGGLLSLSPTGRPGLGLLGYGPGMGGAGAAHRRVCAP
jgi:hypothetical protein